MEDVGAGVTYFLVGFVVGAPVAPVIVGALEMLGDADGFVVAFTGALVGNELTEGL